MWQSFHEVQKGPSLDDGQRGVWVGLGEKHQRKYLGRKELLMCNAARAVSNQEMVSGQQQGKIECRTV